VEFLKRLRRKARSYRVRGGGRREVESFPEEFKLARWSRVVAVEDRSDQLGTCKDGCANSVGLLRSAGQSQHVI
jgi:hypothetical protein